ncbi:hypothetical protein [Cellulosimicrobium sp. NPDC057127]|uniref:hypothetical protein n=1 Tax=Cellulosimicrobium sp. NPDC057127 TaxID=3346026 RepID=UPI003632F212
MRLATRTSVLAASALLLAACSSSPDPAAPSPTIPSSSAPSPTGSSAPTTEAPDPSAPAVPTDLPADVMLPGSVWEAAGDPREESEGATAWRLPDACSSEPPADAAAMRTVLQGDGAAESPIGVQQVAVFADADAAVAAADGLDAAIAACGATAPDETSGGTTFVAEPLDVGAQGAGLATDHYGASQSGELDDALGTYLAATRRGTAVTLVALDGGESTVGTARETVVANTQAAWDLLCRYDSAGC